jgi:hypothetical protein
MDNLVKAAKDCMYPPEEKTFTEQCGDYIKGNPGTVAKGTAVGVVAWFTVPVIIASVAWLPYLGAGYYIYNNTRVAQQTYSWYEWGKSWGGA